MNRKQIFKQAYNRLLEIYSGEQTSLDIRILSRFYQEKMILQESEIYTRYLVLLGKIRQVATSKGEHISVRGPVGSSFIAYLLGATDINPLPRYEYCPQCHCIQFNGDGSPFDETKKKCSCGADLVSDGHNIPFEPNIGGVFPGCVQLAVSYAFFKESEQMIRDEMWDQAIVTLRNEEFAPTWFCFLDKERNEDGEYILNGNTEIFNKLPRITLVPYRMLDKYRELETVTGYKMKEIGDEAYSEAFFQFMEGNIQGIP